MGNTRMNRQVALVIDASGAAPTGDLMAMIQLASLLYDHRVPASWVVDSPSIADAILPSVAEGSLIEWALPWTGGNELAAAASNRLLQSLRSAGMDVSVAFASTANAARGHERRLSNMDIGAVVVDVNVGAPKPLPHGLWQFGVDVSVPHTSRWSSFLGSHRRILQSASGPMAVVVVSVARLRAGGNRGAKQVERWVERLASAAGRGDLEIRSIGELVAERTAAYANRPQRSILRAA